MLCEQCVVFSKQSIQFNKMQNPSLQLLQLSAFRLNGGEVLSARNVIGYEYLCSIEVLINYNKSLYILRVLNISLAINSEIFKHIDRSNSFCINIVLKLYIFY